MAICDNCGKPLILNGGKCSYCGMPPKGESKPQVVLKPPFAPVSSTELRLEIVNGQVFCTDCSFIVGHLVIPTVVKGETVTGIVEKAFVNCS